MAVMDASGQATSNMTTEEDNSEATKAKMGKFFSWLPSFIPHDDLGYQPLANSVSHQGGPSSSSLLPHPFQSRIARFISPRSGRRLKSRSKLDLKISRDRMTGGVVSTSGPVVGETRILAKANLRPLLFCSLAVSAAVIYGFDGTYWSAILEMDKFKQDFGQSIRQPDGTFITDITSSQRSIVTSIIQAGEFCGALFAGPIGDWFGRRGAFFGAIFFLTVGTILQLVVAGNLALVGVGRALLGIGVGMIANATPLYLSEISTTAIRGAVVGSWQLMLAIGQVVGACVGQGTHNLKSSAAYRIPIGLNLAFALFLFVAQFIIPESPRWLVSKGRDDQAKRELMRIHKDQNDPDFVVAMQYQSFHEAHEEEKAMGKSGWKSLLQGVEARKLLIVCGILTAQQIGGVQFIFSYTTTFFAKSGIQDSFLVTIIVDVIEVVGVLCSFFVVNRFGRRPLLIWSSVPMFISLFVCGGLGRDPEGLPQTPTQNRVLVAMICVYVFFFNVAWGPLAWVVASECSAGQNRQRLMSLGSATFFVWAFVVAFTLPYLFDSEEANLGTNIGWIYGVGTLVALAFVYFCVPETLGRSLEEINEMINAKVPTRHWPSYITTLQRDDRVAQGAEVASLANNSNRSQDEDLLDDKKTGAHLNANLSGTSDADLAERQ
ncbi:hypothetical protein CBS101457_002085 [Exobasidium rhododendri]|nr:hypothetical protein CBS101457_002085 [Exobasidium rhododendri]